MHGLNQFNKPIEFLDPISQIRVDSSKGIETIFIKKIPDKKDIKRYYFNNKLLNTKEALELAHRRKIKMPTNVKKYNFFIYHQSLGIVPFQKGDFVITDEGYTTTDGKYVSCYDNQGNELGYF